MKHAFLALGFLLVAGLPAKADISHQISRSFQLDVHGATNRSVRIDSRYRTNYSPNVEEYPTSAALRDEDLIPKDALIPYETPAFEEFTIREPGVANDLSGSIDAYGEIHLNPGGPGTSAIGQVISDLTVR